MSVINWNERDANGTSWRGYLPSPYGFEETVARLIGASGQNPTARSDGENISVAFSGFFKGQVFTLYDWCGSQRLHIGGGPDFHAVLPDLVTALAQAMRETEPQPYTAVEAYEYDRVHRWPVKPHTCKRCGFAGDE